MLDDVPPIHETAPSVDNVKVAVAKCRCGKKAGICNISAKLLKTVCEAMMCGLHAMLTDWRKGKVLLTWKGTIRTATANAI